MKRDQIDILLQLAFLEGVITTHGLYEKTAEKRKSDVAVAPETSDAFLKKLEHALLIKSKPSFVPLTIGAFLRDVRTQRNLRPLEVSSRLGVSANIYRMLEHDRISPLKVPLESWKKLRRLFRLSTEATAEMIRRTHQLVWFEPSFKTTLARYDTRKRKTAKSKAIETAAKELYTRAILTLPEEEERKLSALIQSLADAE
jgi:transcriptional regulator with XRE-family HTH domain